MAEFKKKVRGKALGKSSPRAMKLPEQVDVHYVKTDNYRTYHVDGIFGGLTPSAKIYSMN